MFVNDVEINLDELKKNITDFEELQKRGISEEMILNALKGGKK